jgi:flagellin
MAISIHTNYAALLTQTNMAKSGTQLGVNQQRLGTGFRVNSAADDAAGLQIATRLNAQGRGQLVAQRNAQDGISLLQTAEGALNEFTNVLLRMKDLAIQGSNGTNGTSEYTALDAEFTTLNDELQNILDNTNYGAGNNLLTTKLAGAITLHVGASDAEIMTVDVSAEVGALAVAATTLADQAGSLAAITELDGLLDAAGAARGAMGANINRLNHTINNLANMSDNTNTAMGRIMDTDFAAESAKMAKNNMLMQSGISMLKQTSQMPSLALSLLG